MCSCTPDKKCEAHQPEAHAGRIARSATFDVRIPDAEYAVKHLACHVCGAPKGVAC